MACNCSGWNEWASVDPDITDLLLRKSYPEDGEHLPGAAFCPWCGNRLGTHFSRPVTFPGECTYPIISEFHPLKTIGVFVLSTELRTKIEYGFLAEIPILLGATYSTNNDGNICISNFTILLDGENVKTPGYTTNDKG